MNPTIVLSYVKTECETEDSRFPNILIRNSLSTVQPALLDRMEIIEINGYTMEEKVEIAKKYLVPKQLSEHGLKKKDLEIGPDELEFVIDGYTRESGVRNLDKQIASLVRGTAKEKALGNSFNKKMLKEDVRKILGIPRFEHDRYENSSVAGVVTGLAWTAVGGDILYIESSISPGKGRLTITGNLGDVMKESASIALGYIKAHFSKWNIDPKLFDATDLHIHVPEGATPKDGPSAGITMLTSLVSSYTQRQVKAGIAMTGEITLRGKVLPVGGIKEKILAAKRAGIKTILLCKENRKDIEEINQDYIRDLEFIFVDRMEEVIEHAISTDLVENSVDLKAILEQSISNK